LPQGKLQDTLDAYQQSLAIAKSLAEQDKSNSGWQRDLAVSYSKVGNVLEAQGKLQEALDAYQEDLAISKSLAKQDKSNSERQQDLAVSYEKVGDVLEAQGKLQDALYFYQQGLAIFKWLAEQDKIQLKLAVGSLGELRTRWRSAGGARQAPGSSECLPAKPGDRRTPSNRPTPGF
jgi:tetratricopeptide (TPR) repeat protein